MNRLVQITVTVIFFALSGVAAASARTDAQLALTDAGAAVEAAARADAIHYANAELQSAQAMLADAQDAYEHRHWNESMLDAESARVDANLAAARSRQHSAEATTTELESTVRSLRDRLGPQGGQP